MTANAVSTAAVSSPPRRIGIGVLFLGFFATLWLLLGFAGLFGAGWVLLAPAAVGGGILFAGWRLTLRETSTNNAGDSNEVRRRGRVFRNVNLTQWGAIVGMIVLLNVVGHVEWITPSIMFIVGIHFIPLAFLFHNKAHLITGPALAALAVVYPFVTPDGPASPWGPMAAGVILSVAACHMLIKSRRRPAA